MAFTTKTAADAATCCHRTDTRLQSDAMLSAQAAANETFLEGKGLMSMTEPVLESCSSPQLGKVPSKQKVKMDSAVAARLGQVSVDDWALRCSATPSTDIKPGNTKPVLNRPAISMTFS